MASRTHVCPHRRCPNLTPCPVHGRPANAPRSPNRDRSAQRRFRKAVLERDSFTCVEAGCGHQDPTGRTLRACHLRPLAQGGDYSLSNGVTRCADCDRRTDPYAR